MIKFHTLFLVGALCSLPLSIKSAQVIAKSTKGTPSLSKVDVIGFAPGGVLLIGDGAKQQIVAVKTGDRARPGKKFKEIKGFAGEVAGRLGVGTKDVALLDMAVNPDSGRLYVVARRQDTKAYFFVTVSPTGEIAQFDLEDVHYAQVPLPKGDSTPVSLVTDLAWAGDRLVAAARCNEEFRSKIFATEGSLVHGKSGQLATAESYHVSHRKWETKAPMSVLIPFEENGEHYIIGAFSCTPVVKYPVSDIKPGGKVKGISMIELGSGNRPLDMFAYSKNGKASVLANTLRFHHKRKPFGPSPYWAARFDRDLLAGDDQVNEKATRRLKGYEPITEKIELVEAFHGVTQMDRLNDDSAIAWRKTEKDVDLVVLQLP